MTVATRTALTTLGILGPCCWSCDTSVPRAAQLLFKYCLYRPEQRMSVHPDQSGPSRDLLCHAWDAKGLLRTTSSYRDRTAVGEGLVCVSPLPLLDQPPICPPQVAHDADFSSLTETALAMTIFRDEGKYLYLSSFRSIIESTLRPFYYEAC